MICTKIDAFIEDKPIWIADLSDGTSVYQDDLREGYEEPIAWRRLKSHVNTNKISILNLHLKLRSHIISPVEPNNIEGYFFCNKIVQFLGGRSLDFYIVGFLKEGKVYRKTFKVPELTFWDEDIKLEHHLADDFIIRN